jgi:sodium-dependent dicarboxylate transporter 2/3/5
VSDGQASPQASAPVDARPLVLLLGVVLAALVHLAVGLLPFPEEVPPGPARMAAAVTALTATCWLGNGLPLGPASLLPLALMPLLGALPIASVAPSYAHPILWLFFGGFVLAIGIERWGLHRRLALRIVALVGLEPSRLVLGFMIAGAFLSMWMSNTATTLLLFPIARALVDSLVRARAVEGKGSEGFGFALLLGIAYACSAGGIATPIGTAPNALFLSFYGGYVAKGAPPIGFPQWMMLALPVTLILVPVIWLYLTRVSCRVPRAHPAARAILDEEIRALPPLSSAEKRMAGLFALVALLWITRQDFRLGEAFFIPGWWRLLPVESAAAIGDGAVAVLVAILAFLVPSGRRKGEALMDWDHARRMPWDILFLLGGGVAIARAFEDTGLSAAIGLGLKPALESMPPLAMILMVCTLVTFLTEVTSNTAVIALLLPVLAGAAAAANVDPRLLLVPATLSASCAFMLPIATPPNAIVYASGLVPMAKMARTGIWMNLIGIVVITLVVWLVGTVVLGIDTGAMPDWGRG